ncbi:MAG: tyrosine-type recombinase/integrase [Acidimicrobiales bacterium]
MPAELVATHRPIEAVEAELQALAIDALELETQARSARTEAEYAKDWAVFTAWCSSRGLEALPASVSTVALFATDQAKALKPSTVERRLTSINVRHGDAGHAAPGKDPRVRKLLKGIRRASVESAAADGGKAKKQAAPILRDQLLAMLPSARSDALADVRDRALLLVGFSGFFRRSELASITVENITEIPGGVRIHLPVTKTSKDGAGQDRDIMAGSSTSCPVAALRRWLAAAGVEAGPVFRSVNRHGHISSKAISDRSVDLVIRSRAEAAGIDDNVSGHSLRRGAATQASTDGHAMLSITRAGGWTDGSKAAASYIEAGKSTGLQLL